MRLEGEAVVIRRGGRSYTIPFGRLSSGSVRQAKRLGGGLHEVRAGWWAVLAGLWGSGRESGLIFSFRLQYPGSGEPTGERDAVFLFIHEFRIILPGLHDSAAPCLSGEGFWVPVVPVAGGPGVW